MIISLASAAELECLSIYTQYISEEHAAHGKRDVFHARAIQCLRHSN